MENKRLKINIKTIILIISIIIFASISVITFAWFTDKESYSGTLDFGTIELDVSGTGIENTNKTLKFDVTRTNGTYTAGGKVMPGDTVNIPIKVSLTSESEAAYYMIFLSDPKGIFESGAYFSDDGTNVYVSDGTKIYNQKTKATVTDKIVGKLSKGTTGHDITISATISTDFEEQNATTQINCTVCAIQQANISEEDAKIQLNLNGGHNILPINYNVASATHNEINIINNNDGTFTLNGTAAGNYLVSVYLGVNSLNIPVSGEYLIIYGISGTVDGTTFASVICNGEDIGTTTFDVKKVELNGTMTSFYMAFRKDSILTNFVIKPQLIKIY